MRALLSIIAAMVLLFVVVCPLTITPTAVVNGKVDTGHVHFAPVLMSLSIPGPAEFVGAPVSENDPSAVFVADVRDLTCTRLC